MLADTTSSAAEACGLVTLTKAWLLLPPVELEAPSTSATSTQGCCVPLLLEAEEGGSVDWGGRERDGEGRASVRSHLASSQQSVCI